MGVVERYAEACMVVGVGLFFASSLCGALGADRYPVVCTREENALLITLDLGEAASSAEVVYAEDKKLVVRANSGDEAITFTVDGWFAHLVVAKNHTEQQGADGEMLFVRYAQSSRATYPYILPVCVADHGALYRRDASKITLITLPATDALPKAAGPD